MNNAKIKKFHDEELKKIARKQKSIQVRIIKVKLKTGETEILFTNLPKEIATSEELKHINNGERWKVETDYDNSQQTSIEKIQWKKTNHNRTRLLQPHIPTKPTNRNKKRCRTKKITRKNQKENSKNTPTNTTPISTHSSEKSKTNYQDS